MLHDVTRCFRRVFKKPYKNSFCLNTVLLDAKQTEKHEKKNKKRQNTYTLFGGP